MVVGALRQLGISIALGSCLALGCGGEKSGGENSGGEKSGGEKSEKLAPRGTRAPAAAVEDIWLTELPANFPEDVPRYPGAEVVKSRPPSEEGWSVTFSTPDDPAKVAAYFADTFAAQGWSTQRVDAPEGTMVFADKGERSATYGIGTVEGKTELILLVMQMR